MTVQFSGYAGSATESLTFPRTVYLCLEDDDTWYIRQLVGKSGRSKVTRLSLDEYMLDYAHADSLEVM